jgi:hypothetical protein
MSLTYPCYHTRRRKGRRFDGRYAVRSENTWTVLCWRWERRNRKAGAPDGLPAQACASGPGHPCLLASLKRGPGQNFHVFVGDGLRGAWTLSRSARISNAEAYSSVFTKSASALASSAETRLKAFLCSGFLESLPLLSRSGPARRSGWSLSAPGRPGPVLPSRDNRRTWFYGSLFRPARTQAKSKSKTRQE